MLVLGLDKFVEDLTEISGRAAKEFSLEKVSKIIIKTRSLVLPCYVCRFDTGCFLRKNFQGEMYELVTELMQQTRSWCGS